MKKVTLAGVEVPAIGIGTWHMGEDPSQEQREINAIRSGLDAGARLISLRASAILSDIFL